MQTDVNPARPSPRTQSPGTSIGGWLFRRRTWLPLLIAPVLLLPYGVQANTSLDFALGAPLLLLGEATRLFAVGFAGRVTRTRSGVLSPLVTVGPYRFVRNPLYLGNLLLFAGIMLLFGRWLVLLPLLIAAFTYYQAIVLWEETLLRRVFGAEYDEYCAHVRRWMPRLNMGVPPSIHRFDLWAAIRSERGTLAVLSLVIFLYVMTMLAYGR